MAIYHLSVKPVSRAGGRSATAAAAYRAAELVRDHTTGEAFDYTRKRGVEHAEIVLPTAAAKRDINWARDREALWNAAERAENRSNSRVAREYEVALPHELSKAQRLELVRGFAAEIANRHGVAVDFAIHAPHRLGDSRNHHAHLLATTRVIEPGGLGEKATMEWSDTNRRQAGLEPAKREIGAIRERWAAFTNEKLLAHGHEIRVDHRSLQAQGIEREATTHLGPAVSAMERRGMETEVGRRLAWERGAEQQRRLERAVELGRVEREERELVASILDVSGDLKLAKTFRELGQGHATGGKPQSMEELQREAREKWLAMRQAEAAKQQELARAVGSQVEPAVAEAQRRRSSGHTLEAWRQETAARPIEQQEKIVEMIRERLVARRRQRIERIQGRLAERVNRRERRLEASHVQQPAAPKGLLAGLRRRAYEEQRQGWSLEHEGLQSLAQQARNLDYALHTARDSMNLRRYADQVIRERDPQLLERVQAHRQQLRQQEIEKARTQERARGLDDGLSL